MTRDFTEAAREQLKKQIDDVAVSGVWDTIMDRFGDVGTRLFCAPDIEDDINDVSSYHAKVLDAYNYKKSKIDAIFDAVEAVDADRKTSYDSTSEDIAYRIEHMKNLSSAIDPNCNFISADSICSACSGSHKDLDQRQDTMYNIFDVEMDYANKLVIEQAGSEVLGDLFGAAADLCSFCTTILHDPVGAVADGWQVINDVFKIGQHLLGLVMTPIGSLVSGFTNSNLVKMRVRANALDDAQDYTNREGLKDEFKALADSSDGILQKIYTALYYFSDGADTAAAVYGAYTLLSGTFGKIKKGYKLLTDGRYNMVQGWKEIILGELGFKDLPSSNYWIKIPKKILESANSKVLSKVYREAERAARVVSNIKSVYDIVVAAIQGDKAIVDEIVGDTTLGKILKKIPQAINAVVDYWQAIQGQAPVIQFL